MLVPSIEIRQSGLATSLVLHAIVLACAIWFVHPRVLPEVVEQAISVDIVTLPRIVAKKTASSPSASVPPRAAAPQMPLTAPASTPGVPEMIHATKMLTAAVFSDPRNAEAREMLGQLDISTLRRQLCGIEAMEQIQVYKPQWRPEMVVADAFADALTDGVVVTAEGAAVLIGGQWRRLSFKCTLARDLRSVTAFDFRVGEIVSDEDAEAYDLAAGEPD